LECKAAVTDIWPDHAIELDACLAHAWSVLEQSVVNRRAAMHTPSVATIGLDGSPRSRTVVLRHVDRDEKVLRFHTDVRSGKFSELTLEPRLSFLFYDADEKFQIRVEAVATLHGSDRLADNAWAATQAMSRHAYVVEPASGSIITTGGGFLLTKGRELSDRGRPNFCVVQAAINRIETLWLGSDGHRRAFFEWKSGQAVPRMNWLVP